jgi:hypothetical protein
MGPARRLRIRTADARKCVDMHMVVHHGADNGEKHAQCGYH